MKFSFRYLLAMIIFIAMTALAFEQVLVAMKNNSEKNISTAFFETINPFWQMPNIADNQKNPTKIPITIENPLDNPMLISGKIEFFDENNSQISKIGVINQSEKSSWTLVDYITLNTERIIIEPKTSHIFEEKWYGFGDQYINKETEQPTITFTSLHNTFQNENEYRFSFYQKLIAEKHDFHINAKISIDTLNIETSNITAQETKTENLNIPYFLIKKSLNTGLVINFGIVIILLLILSKNISQHKNHEKNIHENISEKSILELRERAKNEIEKLKKRKLISKTFKKIKKKPEHEDK